MLSYCWATFQAEIVLSSYSVKSVRTRSYSRPYYPTFGLNLRMQLECRKMRTKIIPNMDTFHAVSYATGCYILLEFSLSIIIKLITLMIKSFLNTCHLALDFVLFSSDVSAITKCWLIIKCYIVNVSRTIKSLKRKSLYLKIEIKSVY